MINNNYDIVAVHQEWNGEAYMIPVVLSVCTHGTGTLYLQSYPIAIAMAIVVSCQLSVPEQVQYSTRTRTRIGIYKFED